MKLRTNSNIFCLIVFLCGCSSHPETPEEVVKEFSLALSEGRCEDAKDLATHNAQEAVQGSIDAGCEPYECEIDSIICETEDNSARCLCYEERFGMELAFPYLLEKEDEIWLIKDNSKDIDMSLDVD